MYFVNGIFVYFYSFRFRLFIYMNTIKFRNKMNIDVYTCPAAKIKAKPNNISIVVRVLWKKFVFNFDVGAVG